MGCRLLRDRAGGEIYTFWPVRTTATEFAGAVREKPPAARVASATDGRGRGGFTGDIALRPPWSLPIWRLTLLTGTRSLGSLAVLPSSQLESFWGEREGLFSIWINAQWRVCFRWSRKGRMMCRSWTTATKRTKTGIKNGMKPVHQREILREEIEVVWPFTKRVTLSQSAAWLWFPVGFRNTWLVGAVSYSTAQPRSQ